VCYNNKNGRCDDEVGEEHFERRINKSAQETRNTRKALYAQNPPYAQIVIARMTQAARIYKKSSEGDCIAIWDSGHCMTIALGN
jgi:hypothetical protein